MGVAQHSPQLDVHVGAWRWPTRHELRDVTRLAGPIVVVQVGLMTLGLVDVFMVGRVSPSAIAAVALGNFYWVVVAFFGQGVIMVLDPLIAQAVGARDQLGIRLAMQRGLVLVAGVSIFSALILWPAQTVLTWARQPADVIPSAAGYVHAVMPSLPAFFLFVALRQTLQAFHRVAPIVVAVLVANVLHVLLDWVFIFGHWGAPALGAIGAGRATAISRWLLPLIVLSIAGRELVRHLLPRVPGALAWRDLYAMLRVGVPIGLHLFLEVAGFGAAMLLVGLLGTVPLAAHHVTLQLAALTYMVPLGVSAAAAVLVGRAIGARDEDAARREAAASLVIGIGFMGLTALTFLIGAPRLARAFTSEPTVVALATTLLRIAGVFQLFDGAQVVATGILRGAADTRVPMWMNFIGYVVLGVPIGTLLCFSLGLGAPGIWWGLVIGLASAAMLLGYRVFTRLHGTADRLVL
ncbi:MAG: MATE family efflux transporter [Gemmatimonadaceae bacterium]